MGTNWLGKEVVQRNHVSETAHRQTDSRQQKSLTWRVTAVSPYSLGYKPRVGWVPKLCPALDVAAAVCCPFSGSSMFLAVCVAAGRYPSLQEGTTVPAIFGAECPAPPLSFVKEQPSRKLLSAPPAPRRTRGVEILESRVSVLTRGCRRGGGSWGGMDWAPEVGQITEPAQNGHHTTC